MATAPGGVHIQHTVSRSTVQQLNYWPTTNNSRRKQSTHPPPLPPQPRPSPLWTETMLDTVLFQCRAPAISSPFGCTLHSGYFITVFLPPTVEKTDGCWSPQLPFKIQSVAFLKRVQFLKAFTQQFQHKEGESSRPPHEQKPLIWTSKTFNVRKKNCQVRAKQQPNSAVHMKNKTQNQLTLRQSLNTIFRLDPDFFSVWQLCHWSGIKNPALFSFCNKTYSTS